MGKYKCIECGNVKESKCKPKKCPQCGSSGKYEKIN